MAESRREIGIVIAVIPFKNFGWISSQCSAKDIFFHRQAVKDCALEDLQDGDQVSFIFVVGEKGPRAIVVRKV